MAHVLDIDDLFPDPLAVALAPMNDVGREGGADETVARIRVVVEANLEGHKPFLTQVHGVLDTLVLEIPEVDLAAVLELADLLEVEPGMNVFGAAHSDETITLWRGWYQKS